jgi:para-aminobenzoate synthetase
MGHRLLIVDNYDSFTYNLYHLFAEQGCHVEVVRNDEVRYDQIAAADFTSIIVSPGPGNVGNPNDLGVVNAILRQDHRPILGVCLGHQAIAGVEGASVVRAPEPVHGRVFEVQHCKTGLFTDLPSPLKVVRYHSWIVDFLPPVLIADAFTSDGLIMALHHRNLPRWGVQFHPESICTDAGPILARNFLRLAGESRLPGRPSVTWRSGASLGVARVAKAEPVVKHRSMRISVRWIQADRLTTEQIFARAFGFGEGSFWLDSARVTEGVSRFSYMGSCNEGPFGYQLRYDVRSDQLQKRQYDGRWQNEAGNIFDHVRQRTPLDLLGGDDLPFGFRGGFVGYLGYELKSLGGDPGWQAETPDASMLFVDRFIVIDHGQADGRAVGLVTVVNDDADSAQEAEQWCETIEKRLDAVDVGMPTPMPTTGVPVEVTMRHDREAYLERVEQCKELIREGESYELCLTNRLEIAVEAEPSALYLELRTRNPAPYAAFIRFDAHWICSSSPERFLQMDACGLVEAKPIKGTIRRSSNADEDCRLKQQLADSEKDFAENLMIVDLLRNDLGVQCVVGSIEVPSLAAIESYATVHQMVSTIRGRRRPDVHPVDVLCSAFPGGSMTGAPKHRTMQLLDELEGGPRGIYSGALGYIGLDGAADLSVVIRTIVGTAAGLSLGCGGAVTILSDAEGEYDEMLLKAAAPLSAIASCVAGAPDAYVIRELPSVLGDAPELLAVL